MKLGTIQKSHSTYLDFYTDKSKLPGVVSLTYLKSYSIVSRIIADDINAGLIKDFDPDNKSKKYAKYLPI